MRNLLSLLFITLCLNVFCPWARAALMLNKVDLKTAELVTDSTDPFFGCFLSISSELDYIVDPGTPISIDPPLDLGDGLDWIYVYNTNPLQVPVNPLATITLMGIEVFALDDYYTLTLWDETLETQLGSLGISVPEPAMLSLMALGGLALRKR